MFFNEKTIQYLRGNLFSSELVIPVSKYFEPVKYRLDSIVEISKDKNIIHLGCADHLPLIKEKIQNSTWLHGLLHQNSKTCIGIDINQEAVTYIRDELGYDKVFFSNILVDEIIEINGKHWDYLIVGEILEHVDNPQLFLNTIKQKYGKTIDKIIITVPNVYSLPKIVSALFNVERINSDHRYVFSPYSLGKILAMSEIKVDYFFFCEETPKKYSGAPLSKKLAFFIYNRIISVFPALREKIFIVASLN